MAVSDSGISQDGDGHSACDITNYSIDYVDRDVRATSQHAGCCVAFCMYDL